jgi:GNAT superfamily N-acetyltransferase
MVNKKLVDFCGWLLKDRSLNADARDPAGLRRANAFLADVALISHQVNKITHTFCDENQNVTGHIQLDRRGGEVTIHRIWVAKPGQGSGSTILKKVCELADRHGVTLKLSVNPLGVAPYPMSSRQLHSWYHRHGFVGNRKMTRLPVENAAGLNTETRRHGEEKSELQSQTESGR